MPRSQLQKIPEQCKAAAPDNITMKEQVYNALLPNLAPQNMQHPFLDISQLTRCCTMSNYSRDGGHKYCHVNCWKAKLLLNTLCNMIHDWSILGLNVHYYVCTFTKLSMDGHFIKIQSAIYFSLDPPPQY